jgi:hypothetical protein
LSGFLHVSKQPEAAVAVVHNEVLPCYAKLDLPVRAVLTDNGREFCGTERRPYELFLALKQTPHRPGRRAQDQRLRRALQRHRAAGVLPQDKEVKKTPIGFGYHRDKVWREAGEWQGVAV